MFLKKGSYSTNKASPYAKKRYFSLMASWYASMVSSCPAKAEVVINSVLCGVWKLVINASVI